MNDSSGAHDRLPHRELAVLVVESVARARVALGEPAGEPEHLHFLRGLVARADVAQVVELPALGRPAEEQEYPSAAKCVSPRKLGSTATASSSSSHGLYATSAAPSVTQRQHVLRRCRAAAR